MLNENLHGNLPERSQALLKGKPVPAVKHKGKFTSGATAGGKAEGWKARAKCDYQNFPKLIMNRGSQPMSPVSLLHPEAASPVRPVDSGDHTAVSPISRAGLENQNAG